MKVLFVPYCGGVISHEIPLVALDRMLSNTSVETAFLASPVSHRLLGALGSKVLSIDHANFRTEMMAYGKYAPDVVVDDGSYTTGIATTMSGLPRVSVMRTGMFPGGARRNESHRHSMAIFNQPPPDISVLGLRQPRSVSELFTGDLKLIPGVASVEALPQSLQADDTYVYTGPLLMDDLLLRHLSEADPRSIDLGALSNFDSLKEFFGRQRGRKVAYVTFGTQAKPTAPVFECIRFLIESGVAVVSSARSKALPPLAESLDARQRGLYYEADYLPMHFVCENADLMIHHCGSGTYHYPLLHLLPAITVGTGRYDRDDVAARLEELGASIHLPAPEECADFVGDFKEAARKCLDESGEFASAMRRNIARLRDELAQTSAAFDFARVLERAAGLKQRRKNVGRTNAA
jgi:hypothetical protein